MTYDAFVNKRSDSMIVDSELSVKRKIEFLNGVEKLYGYTIHQAENSISTRVSQHSVFLNEINMLPGLEFLITAVLSGS